MRGMEKSRCYNYKKKHPFCCVFPCSTSFSNGARFWHAQGENISLSTESAPTLYLQHESRLLRVLLHVLERRFLQGEQPPELDLDGQDTPPPALKPGGVGVPPLRLHLRLKQAVEVPAVLYYNRSTDGARNVHLRQSSCFFVRHRAWFRLMLRVSHRRLDHRRQSKQRT